MPSRVLSAVRSIDPATTCAALLVVALLMVAAIGVRGLYTVRSLESVVDQASGLGAVALGELVVILIGGIDMSVNAVILLSVAYLLRGGGSLWALVVAALISVAVGLGNGLLIAHRKVPPFIATFGMLLLVGGFELTYTQGSVGGVVPSWVNTLGNGNVGAVPISLLVWLGSALIVGVVLNRTVIGRSIYAIGSNPGAASHTGLPVSAVRVGCYVACSFLAFIGGLMLAGYSGSIDQTLGSNANLNSIAAVVIGGAAFVGGKGKVSGAIIGVLVITTANNLVVLAGMPVYWQYIVTGAVLIVAVMGQAIFGGGAPILTWSVARRLTADKDL